MIEIPENISWPAAAVASAFIIAVAYVIGKLLD